MTKPMNFPERREARRRRALGVLTPSRRDIKTQQDKHLRTGRRNKR